MVGTARVCTGSQAGRAVIYCLPSHFSPSLPCAGAPISVPRPALLLRVWHMHCQKILWGQMGDSETPPSLVAAYLISPWCSDGTEQFFRMDRSRFLCSCRNAAEFCTTQWVTCVCFPSRRCITKACKCIQFLCWNSKAVVTHGFFSLVPKGLKAHVQSLLGCAFKNT